MKMIKTIPYIFILTVLSYTAQAQLETPAPSPYSKLEQKVGLTDVTVEYSRPSVKGRMVFGDLVRYGEPWRTGANAATKLTFSTKVKIEGKDLAAGEYALITIPSKDEWELHFFPYTKSSVGSYMGDDAGEATIVKVEQRKMPISIETFLIDIGNLRNSSATLNMMWENTWVSAKIEVPTDDIVETGISEVMDNATADDYRAAASYYLEEGKDMNKALEWINKALDMGGERYWILRDKAKIQAALGDYEGAIATAKRSTEVAKEAGNMTYHRGNDALIAKWKEM